jgi:hypothetical protein
VLVTAVNPNIYVFKLWEACGQSVGESCGTPENSGFARDWKLQRIYAAFIAADERLKEKDSTMVPPSAGYFLGARK